MQVGYFTMPLHPPGSDPSQTMEADLVQMETLDRQGYREAWIGEHFTAAWENIPAPDQFIPTTIKKHDRCILHESQRITQVSMVEIVSTD